MSRSAIRFFALFMLAGVFLTALQAYGSVHAPAGAADCCHHGDSADHSSPGSDSDSDGCHSCGTCPCHAPLAYIPTIPPFAPAVASLQTVEKTTAIPEVFIPKFIPPQNA